MVEHQQVKRVLLQIIILEAVAVAVLIHRKVMVVLAVRA
jgi:hypothetical protein